MTLQGAGVVFDPACGVMYVSSTMSKWAGFKQSMDTVTINVHSEMVVSALDHGVGAIIWRVARICTQHRVESTHG